MKKQKKKITKQELLMIGRFEGFLFILIFLVIFYVIKYNNLEWNLTHSTKIEWCEYTIQEGDSLYGIADKLRNEYNIPISKACLANMLYSKNKGKFTLIIDTAHDVGNDKINCVPGDVILFPHIIEK